jgi:hypothetical protein
MVAKMRQHASHPDRRTQSTWSSFVDEHLLPMCVVVATLLFAAMLVSAGAPR